MSTGGRGIVTGAQSFEGHAGGEWCRGQFTVERDMAYRDVVMALTLRVPEEYIIQSPHKDHEFGALRNVLTSSAMSIAEKIEAIALFVRANADDPRELRRRPGEEPQPENRRALDLGGERGA